MTASFWHTFVTFDHSTMLWLSIINNKMCWHYWSDTSAFCYSQLFQNKPLRTDMLNNLLFLHKMLKLIFHNYLAMNNSKELVYWFNIANCINISYYLKALEVKQLKGGTCWTKIKGPVNLGSFWRLRERISGQRQKAASVLSLHTHLCRISKALCGQRFYCSSSSCIWSPCVFMTWICVILLSFTHLIYNDFSV